jgi:hypothetical protein
MSMSRGIRLPNYLALLAETDRRLRLITVDGRKILLTAIRPEELQTKYELTRLIYVERSSKRIKLPKVLDANYAYLLGALREAVVYEPEYEITFVQKDKSWLTKSVAPRLQTVFGLDKTHVRKRKGSTYSLKVNSEAIVAILKVHAAVSARPALTPPVIARAPFCIQRYYIAAFYDSEGDKDIRRLRIWQSWNDASVCPPLEDLRSMLKKAAIASRISHVGSGSDGLHEFCLEIHSSPVANRNRFLRKIPLEHPRISLGGPRKFRRA